MNLVTEGGTGNSAMAPVKAAGIRSGGKTGTAQKAVPVLDPVTGEPKKKVVIEHDFKGKVIVSMKKRFSMTNCEAMPGT